MTTLSGLRQLATGCVSAIGLLAFNTSKAEAYQIDCAILLCLSGGWPASAECSAARAEFIRRITPWPIEPPLQIWRCPMGAAYTVDPDTLTVDRIYQILMESNDSPAQSTPHKPLSAMAGTLTPQPAVQRFSGGTAARLPQDFMLKLVQDYSDNNGTADINISGPEFNFVRSIRVYSVEAASQHSKKDDVCQQYQNVKVGTYGVQGDFNWQRSRVESLPEAVTGFDHWEGRNGVPRYSSSCRRIYQRSVFVDWKDYEGNYGFEQVNY